LTHLSHNAETLPDWLRLPDDRAETPRRAPWEAEPRRLWSRLEMEQYKVGLVALVGAYLGETVENARLLDVIPDMTSSLVRAITDMTQERFKESLLSQLPPHVKMTINLTPTADVNLRGGALEETLSKASRESADDCLSDALKAAEELRLPKRWEAKLERIKASLEHSDAKTLSILLREVISDLKEELKEPLFLRIDARKREYFDQTVPPFGVFVDLRFPDSVKDIRAASRCLALDEWTACVFHTTRALQPALYVLAEKVGGVVFKGPIDLQNWKEIIDNILSKVNEHTAKLENTPKSHARNSELRMYGELAIQLRHFKNAWRNDVAHREHYDERDAEEIFTAARTFMQKMAEVV